MWAGVKWSLLLTTSVMISNSLSLWAFSFLVENRQRGHVLCTTARGSLRCKGLGMMLTPKTTPRCPLHRSCSSTLLNCHQQHWLLWTLASRHRHIGISSVQFCCSVVSDSLWPHESQHFRPPSPSPTPGVYSNSSSRWCHPAISSVIHFSSCPQSLPASGSFPMSQLFASGGQSIGVSASASVLPMNTQDWSPKHHLSVYNTQML